MRPGSGRAAASCRPTAHLVRVRVRVTVTGTVRVRVSVRVRVRARRSAHRGHGLLAHRVATLNLDQRHRLRGGGGGRGARQAILAQLGELRVLLGVGSLAPLRLRPELGLARLTE